MSIRPSTRWTVLQMYLRKIYLIEKVKIESDIMLVYQYYLVVRKSDRRLCIHIEVQVMPRNGGSELSYHESELSLSHKIVVDGVPLSRIVEDKIQYIFEAEAEVNG